MKNLFRFMMAVAILLTASCAKEDISSSLVANGETVEVTFSANLADLGTRAYGEGELATKLKFFVYQYDESEETVGAYLPGVLVYNAEHPNGTYEIGCTTPKYFNFSLTLVKGMRYNILFWADNENSPYEVEMVNGVPTGAIKVNYDRISGNNESLDAFFGKLVDFDPATDAADAKEIKLKRPFAQLNAYTDDCQSVKLSGISKLTTSSIKIKRNELNDKLDLFTGVATCNSTTDESLVEFTGTIPTATTEIGDQTKMHLSMNYLLVNGEKALINVEFAFVGERNGADFPFTVLPLSGIPVQRNYKTNITGKLLTNATDFTVEILPGFEAEYGVEEDVVSATVNNVEQFATALADDDIDTIVLGDDINLNDLLTRAEADPSYTVKADKTLTIDLNGKKLSATSTQTGKNYNMFNVKGSLTVKNGTIEYKHEGENMGWNSSTNIFDVTAGGVLNLDGVTAKNLGGSDMGFVAHLNNWGEVTLNVENSTLESNYVAVRVFNSGYDMNNVTIKNSTLTGVSAAFWVHNYTAADFGSQDKAEAQKALLNLNIYNQGNTFSPDINGIRYGFTNSIRTDAYGITKTVSEDGTEVTLGSIIENGLIRRGVAGEEENTTIKKAIVGEGVTTLYDRTFRRFYALETVELPSTLTTIGAAGSGVFQSCNNLKNIVLPESVTVLGKGTFQECSSLESINIPAGVTRIESDCLRATGLVEVEFHAGVTYFGAQAFRDCKQLKKVVINAPEFTVEANAFGVMSGAPGTTIYVANAEMKAYLENTLSYKNQFTIVAPELVKNTADLQAALAEGKNVALAAGEYTFPAGNVYAGNVKVAALEGANVVLNLPQSTYISGTSLTLEGVTIKVPAGLTYNESKFGFIHHAAELNIKNCVIEGGRLRLNVAKANIDKCQFNVTASSGFDGYGLFYYGNNNSTVNVSNSTFTCLQKAIVLYNERDVTMNLNVDNCTFTASETTDKAAISIHSEWGINGTVNIKNSNATGFADYHEGLWRDVNNNTGVDNNNFVVIVE